MYRMHGLLFFISVGGVAGIAIGWLFGVTGAILGGVVGIVVGGFVEDRLYRIDQRSKAPTDGDGADTVDRSDPEEPAPVESSGASDAPAEANDE